MLNNLINNALNEHQYTLVDQNIESVSYFKKETGNFKRYIITYNLDKLENAEEINEKILNLTPQNLLESQAFSKNTDLVIMTKFDTLSDYKKFENQIFDIEENVYHFKKYILYYIEEELEFIRDKSFTELKQILSDHSSFITYKNSPLTPTPYNFIARIFIKLPFLELPHIKSEMVPINIQIKNLVSEIKLAPLYDNLKNYQDMPNNEFDNLIEELIK